MDGIDAAIIRTDGKIVKNTGHFISVPYEQEVRDILLHAVTTKDKKDASEAEREITIAHANVVQTLLEKSGLSKSDIDVIGFHGHTIDHNRGKKFTWQIGDGKLLAKLTGIDVVNDFRSSDVKGGGQGAPLVPLYHAALVHDQEKPIALLNIGGVANVTYIGKGHGARDMGEGKKSHVPYSLSHTPYILAFDTGPGNAMIDDWVFKHIGEYFDKDGEVSGKGVVDKEVLKNLLSNPYFSEKPPKSLDRNNFSPDLISHLSLEDGAATLAAFTAASVAEGCKHFPDEPKNWYVTGGGRYNRRIMQELEGRLIRKVQNIEVLGFNGDALEAEAFAFLAVRTLRKLPISLPSTTGVKKSLVTGGVFCPA